MSPVLAGAGMDYVFVTEDRPTEGSRGCDAVSVFDLALDAPVHRGQTHISPGRIGASSDLAVVLATQTNTDPFVYALWRTSTDYRNWVAGSIRESESATFGGIAVLDDARSFLVATAAIDRWLQVGFLVNHPPYHVRRYRMPAGRGDGIRVGQELGRVPVDGVAVEILLQQDQKVAHVLTDAGTVYSIDVDSMMPISATIRVAPLVGVRNPVHGTPLNHIHAVLTPDERYLVTNRGRVAEISVADLRDRTSWTIPLRADLEVVGGVAIAGAGPNAGLLAVHAADKIALYRFAPHGPLVEAGRMAVRVPAMYVPQYTATVGPHLSIAWSGRGDALIAATEAGTAEFVVLDVADGGRTITPRAYLTACAMPPNQPNDILAAAPDQPRSTPSPLPTPTASLAPSPTPSPSATAAPSATPTSPPSPTRASSATACPPPTITRTPTPTATPVPAPVFLPLALRERCPVDKQHADVALVIDASTSMRDDRTASGRTKLEAALEAAAAFVDALALPADQAAVVAFNSVAWVEVGLTGRRADVEVALARIPAGVRTQTRIDLGVQAAHDELVGPRRRPANRPVMIVLTDGLANPEPASTAVQRAAEAKADEITIFTIGLGDEAALNVAELTHMASGPDYFSHTPDAEDLAAIYRAIALELPCPGVRLWGRR